MAMVSRVVDMRISSLKRQVDNIRTFVTEPVGIFETVDRMVKNFREANRQTIQAVGLRGMRGMRIGRLI